MQALMRVTLAAVIAFSALAGVAVADHKDFDKRIAGTYLQTSEDMGLIVQLGRDETFTLIFSEQFLSLGILGESFSDSVGHWRRVGRRSITANTVNIAYSDVFVGIAAVRYSMSFDRHYRKAVLDCKGAIFAPGVDPFAPGAEPIPGSVFECGQITLERIPK